MSGAAMSPATSAQVRRRQASRREKLERQRRLNEQRRRLDELEVDLATDFDLLNEECARAKQAVQAAELAMGRVVDRMIGELRVRYPRAAELLEVPEDELRRLRQLATDSTHSQEAAHDGTRAGDDGRAAQAAVSQRRTRRGRGSTPPTVPEDAEPAMPVASAAIATVE